MNNIKLIDDDAFCNEYFSFKMYDIFQFVGLLVHNLILNWKSSLVFVSLEIKFIFYLLIYNSLMLILFISLICLSKPLISSQKDYFFIIIFKILLEIAVTE